MDKARDDLRTLTATATPRPRTLSRDEDDDEERPFNFDTSSGDESRTLSGLTAGFTFAVHFCVKK